jgi:hypothetical protein
VLQSAVPCRSIDRSIDGMVTGDTRTYLVLYCSVFFGLYTHGLMMDAILILRELKLKRFKRTANIIRKSSDRSSQPNTPSQHPCSCTIDEVATLR